LTKKEHSAFDREIQCRNNGIKGEAL